MAPIIKTMVKTVQLGQRGKARNRTEQGHKCNAYRCVGWR
jgi:hypothetical protein